MRVTFAWVLAALCSTSAEAALREQSSDVAILSPQPEEDVVPNNYGVSHDVSVQRTSREGLASLWRLAKYVSFFAAIFLVTRCYPLIASGIAQRKMLRRLAEQGEEPCKGEGTGDISPVVHRQKKTFSQMDERERGWFREHLKKKRRSMELSPTLTKSDWEVTFPSDFLEVWTRVHHDEHGNPTGKVSTRTIDYETDSETITIVENGIVLTEQTSVVGGILVPQLSSSLTQPGGEAASPETKKDSGVMTAAHAKAELTVSFPAGFQNVRSFVLRHPVTKSAIISHEGVNSLTGETLKVWSMDENSIRRTLSLQVCETKNKRVLKTTVTEMETGEDFDLMVLQTKDRRAVQVVVEDQSSRSMTDITWVGEDERTYHEVEISKTTAATVTVFETIDSSGSVVGETSLTPSEVAALTEKAKQIDIRVGQLEEEVKLLTGFMKAGEADPASA